MKRQITLTVDGERVKFSRTLGSYVHNFNQFGEHGNDYVVHFQFPGRDRRNKWRAWRPHGQEALATGVRLSDVYRLAKDHWECTLRDGDPELRLKRFQPRRVK